MEYNESEIRFWNKYYLIINLLDDFIGKFQNKLFTNEYSCMYINSHRGGEIIDRNIEFRNPNDNKIVIKGYYKNELKLQVEILPKQTRQFCIINMLPKTERLEIQSYKDEKIDFVLI